MTPLASGAQDLSERSFSEYGETDRLECAAPRRARSDSCGIARERKKSPEKLHIIANNAVISPPNGPANAQLAVNGTPLSKKVQNPLPLLVKSQLQDANALVWL